MTTVPPYRPASEPTPDATESVETFEDIIDAVETYRPAIGCVIPAHNEAESIAAVLESLLMQTRLPDVVHIVVNNSSDDTFAIASNYAGIHTRPLTPATESRPGRGGRIDLKRLSTQTTEIFVHDIGENPDKKVGALNYGFSLVEGLDYLLGVDGDTTADPRAVEQLEAEILSDSRIGGISGIFSIDDTNLRGPMENFLIAGQRAQFAAFNMRNMLRGRNMAVLGGQYSIFSI